MFFVSLFLCLLVGDDVQTNDFELCFWKDFRYKDFCKKLYFGYCNLFIRKDLLQRYLLEKIKSLVRYLQFRVEQKHNLIGHLILSRVFPIRQNVRYVFHLVGQFFILVWHCPMSNHYFKTWSSKSRWKKWSHLSNLLFSFLNYGR